MLDYVVFNALIGNHDAHAKNFSLLYAGKAPVLAPLYDTRSNGQMLCTGVGSGGDFLDVFLNSILEHDSLDDLG